MFSNGRKTIGLMIFNTYADFQSQICWGMAERAEQLGYNLAIISSYGSYGTYQEYYQGEMMIFDLPSYDEFAGIVVAFDTFNIPAARDRILEHIQEEADCPVVSLRERLVGVNNILIDEHHSMEGVIRHIVEEHGKKDIAFMTGHQGRFDAEARLRCFRKAMEKYELPVNDHRIFYGDFWREKGKEACDWFGQGGQYPEAIICANDYMALSVIDELYERGVRVPEDVLVTGFDGVEEGVVYSPSLTTLHVDFKEMAYGAVDLIHKHQDDDLVEDVFVSTKVVARESCGCLERGHSSTIAQRCAQHKFGARSENLEMQFSFMAIDFNQVSSIEEMHQVISKYIYNIENIKNYVICLREDVEENKVRFRGYSDTMHVRTAIKERLDMGEVDIPFERKLLLPEEMNSDEPQCYFFYPIHFQDSCFGYEAYSFLNHESYGTAYVRWTIAVSNAIHNILSQKKMNDLIVELENMYIQDVLTGLYNRRGFEKYGRMQFSKARARDSIICVLGIDLDGLKPINDIYGHHEGDSALRAVGYAIQEAAIQGQIGARIGGDEFEVIFPCRDKTDVENWIQVFEESLDNFNQKSQKPYDVHASWGYKIGVPTVNDTIESYMNESDDIMYKNKVANKLSRNEALR
ncbi:MAG: GGDEF domain-containing protein [Eubacterium sp.]|jgi:diguanylate cyclase (GGDEF)-like protein|nr:GGDEF domain-containing protein [Eubacterium sp.]